MYGFNRLRSVNLDRTELRNCVGNVSAIVLIGTRQSSIARGLDHEDLHFTSHQESFLGFTWQSVRFNILTAPGYERGLSKKSHSTLETSLNHTTSLFG